MTAPTMTRNVLLLVRQLTLATVRRDCIQFDAKSTVYADVNSAGF
jgi:hypothetical protein